MTSEEAVPSIVSLSVASFKNHSPVSSILNKTFSFLIITFIFLACFFSFEVRVFIFSICTFDSILSLINRLKECVCVFGPIQHRAWGMYEKIDMFKKMFEKY